MKIIILYIAMSLDGYIADTAGGIDWLGGHSAAYNGDYGYDAFTQQIDTIVMGKTTYQQITQTLSPNAWPYAPFDTYVLTHQPHPDTANLHFTAEPLAELLGRLRHSPGDGHLWLLGGASLVRQAAQLNAIDEYHITIMPTILGRGLALFDGHPPQTLQLLQTETINGVINTVYRKR